MSRAQTNQCRLKKKESWKQKLKNQNRKRTSKKKTARGEPKHQPYKTDKTYNEVFILKHGEKSY
jgi:hypothetical protein